MRLEIVLFVIAFLSHSFVFAGPADYKDGFYSCRNADPELPRNTYEIKTQPIFTGDRGVPVVEITRYFRAETKGNPPKIEKVILRGAAHVISFEDGNVALKFMNMEIPFKNGEIQKCLP